MSLETRPFSNRSRLAMIGLWFTAALFSCNLGGYPDLGKKLDTLNSIGTSNATAWMRTTREGASEILVLGDASNGNAGGFVWVTMEKNTTGSMLAGNYEVGGNRMTLFVTSEYTKTLELDVPPSSRQGSTRQDNDPPVEMTYKAEKIDERLHLTADDGTLLTMTDLWDVISTIDVSTQAGVNMLARVFNLSTMSLFMRIPGFGGAGLLQYAREPSKFVGIIDGVGSIEMTSVLSPVAEIFFNDFQDYPGISLTGDQISTTDMAGDGHLEGTIRFSMVDPREGGEFSIAGDLTYDLILTNGTSSDGGYTIVLSNDTSWTVPYQEGETMDFRPLLPSS
jgi:hypothetical protein